MVAGLCPQFATGGRFRILNVVDDVTRECLAAIPDTSISGRSVVRELTALIGLRGRPAMIVSDNGAEFTSTAILAWAHDYRVNWQDIARGKPTQRVVGAAIRQDGRAAPLGRRNFAKSEPL